MASTDGLPAALRLLRERAGLSRAEMRQRGGPPASTIAKLESGVRPPDTRTLGVFLDALALDFHDLAHAADEVTGRIRPITGTARPEWVATFVRKGIDSSFLMGFAVAGIEAGDERALQDFIASVEAAAGELARAAVEEARASHEAATKGRNGSE